MRRSVATVLLALLAGCTACDRSTADTPPAFDGTAAMARVKAQMDLGARVPNTPAHVQGGDWIVAQLKPFADTVIVQPFTHVTATGDTLHLRNILARFKPAAAQRVLYLTHWDSRPQAEESKDSAQRKLPTPGANDGASGVALLIGVAEGLKHAPPSVGVDLLFVDGEDWGDFKTDTDVLLGSRYFAEHLPDSAYAPLFGVLFDMIGDADLQIYQEGNSLQQAPDVVARVWAQAKALGHEKLFIPENKWTVTDDHIPLLKKGLHVIDVIDLDYPYHHTREDTIDKVSAASLVAVGQVALALVR
ncbi:MAG: M28 family peptidase [Gemmatimonadetes bacterium]|nr:M28 family peptidase [Gemmatimonadota bacterium]